MAHDSQRRDGSQFGNDFFQSVLGDDTNGENAFKAIEDRFTSLSDVRKEIKKIVNVEIGLVFGKPDF